MWRREKAISLLLIAALILGGLLMFRLQANQYRFPEVPALSEGQTTDLSEQRIIVDRDFEPEVHVGIPGWTNYRSKELLVDISFTSNLPLVIIDVGNQEPKRGVVWDSEKEYYVLTGEDPYAYGEILIIDHPNGVNQAGDEPQTRSLCKVKLRGNSSGNYDKKQYLVKLLDEDGKADKQNILGMGRDSEWILNVSFIDKSLLRNYLAYMTAGEIMPYTPDARFCEVLWKNENGYQYQGVYLMLESVKVGENRVDLPQYSENSAAVPALLRRDRYNETGLMLENYATRNHLASGYLDVEYPDQKTLTAKGVQKITEQVNRFEQALYADDWEDFVEYRNYVDMQSFVDYFVLNEFFLNYDAGYNSTYLYMDYSGKLIMGPVWDFDQAMDNNETIAADLHTTAFHSAPWFDRLLKDPVFTAALIERYGELRKTILSDASIENFVQQVIAYLGPAIERDWARWGYYYTEGGYLKPVDSMGTNRNTKTHQQEVDRILNVLHEHGAWMDEHLDSLYQFKMCSLEQAEAYLASEQKDYRPALAVVFVAAVFISVRLVMKHESE